MKLGTYLRKNGIPQSEFARILGVTQQAVAHWVAGERFPRRGHLIRIHQKTDGAVTPRDFIDHGGVNGYRRKAANREGGS